MNDIVIQKGSRIRAAWLETHLAALAGVQMKTAATAHSIVGTIRHIRSNDPNFSPDKTMLFVELDDGTGQHCDKCGVNEVQIKPSWIREVISL